MCPAKVFIRTLAALVVATVLLLSSHSARAADVCDKLDQTLKPVVATHIIPPYPPLSQMTGEEGTTGLLVTIGTDGVPTEVNVDNSSGSLRLDQAAVDFVKASWRWQAPIMKCQPVAARTKVSIVWSLRDAPLGPPPGVVEFVPDALDYPPEAVARHEQGGSLVAVVLSDTGEIVLAKVVVSSGFPDLDEKALQLAKSRKWAPAQMNGKPITTLVELGVEWKLPGAKAN